jgi:hypothetical protein
LRLNRSGPKHTSMYLKRISWSSSTIKQEMQ